MPYYDFKCNECGKLVEDEFFKIDDTKYIECCSIQMKQVILKAPGISDPNGVRGGWTNDGYQERDETTGKLRTITERWKKGKNVIRDDVHKDDPSGEPSNDERMQMTEKDWKRFYRKDHYDLES